MFVRLFLRIKDFITRASHKAADRLIFAALALLGFGLLFVIAWYAGAAKIAGVISAVPLWQFASLFGFAIVVYAIATMRWLLILRGYGYTIPFFRVFFMLFKAATVSLVFPSFEISGETYKAFQLQKFGVSKPAAFAAVFFEFFTIFLVNAAGGLVVLAFIMVQGWRTFSLVGFASTILFAGAALFLFKKFSRQGWFTAMVKRSIPLQDEDVEAVGLFDYGISFFLHESRRYLIAAALVTVAGFSWEIAQIGFVARFLGIPTDALTVAVLYIGVGLFNSMPVFGGLGFGEAGAFFAGASVGVGDAQSLALMFLLRVRQLFVLALGALYFIRDALSSVVRRSRG